MKAEAQPASVQVSAKRQLGLGVLVPNGGHHARSDGGVP
jgi:hypothetical protein